MTLLKPLLPEQGPFQPHQRDSELQERLTAKDKVRASQGLCISPAAPACAQAGTAPGEAALPRQAYQVSLRVRMCMDMQLAKSCR